MKIRPVAAALLTASALAAHAEPVAILFVGNSCTFGRLDRAMYTALYGSVAGCVAAGGTMSGCNNNTLRVIPGNPNANPLAKVYLTQDLGIAAADAIKLQRIASDQLMVAGIALTFVSCLHANRPVDHCRQTP